MTRLPLRFALIPLIVFINIERDFPEEVKYVDCLSHFEKKDFAITKRCIYFIFIIFCLFLKLFYYECYEVLKKEINSESSIKFLV